MEMDVFEQIHEDHRRVDELIRQWMDQGHGEGRTAADQISDLLLPHAKAEEISLYALLREHEEARQHIVHAIAEHRVIEYQVRELVRITPGHQDDLRERLEEVRELIRRHVSSEEGTTFSLARDLLSEEVIRDLGQRFPINRERFREQYWMAA